MQIHQKLKERKARRRLAKESATPRMVCGGPGAAARPGCAGVEARWLRRPGAIRLAGRGIRYLPETRAKTLATVEKATAVCFGWALLVIRNL